MTNQLKSRIFINSIILVLLGNLVFTNDAFAVVTPPLTKCNIRLGDPHFSTNLQRRLGVLAVKVNAQSKCDRPMRDLQLSVELYKIGFLRDYKVASKTVRINGLVYANRVIYNRGTYVICTDTRVSKYYGLAFASAVIDGKSKKTFKVASAKSPRLRCGN